MYQGVGEIGHGFKASLSGDSGYIHCIGHGVFDGIHMSRRSGNSKHCGVGDHGLDAISGWNRADDARLDRDLASSAGIEVQTQAAGRDLHDLDFVRDLYLIRGEVIGVFARGRIPQVDRRRARFLPGDRAAHGQVREGGAALAE